MMIQGAIDQHCRSLIGFMAKVGKSFDVFSDRFRSGFDKAEQETGIVLSWQELNQAIVIP